LLAASIPCGQVGVVLAVVDGSGLAAGLLFERVRLVFGVAEVPIGGRVLLEELAGCVEGRVFGLALGVGGEVGVELDEVVVVGLGGEFGEQGQVQFSSILHCYFNNNFIMMSEGRLCGKAIRMHDSSML